MKLQRLLYLQGGRCFYCGANLPLDTASIDHVIPQSMGGDNSQENVVACCKTLNQWFAALSPKRKIEIMRNWNAPLPCPADHGEARQDDDTAGEDS
jgi:CRISPR/Cas system Type II protein with McrA/HNH and RuvC-like nuclease domain